MTTKFFPGTIFQTVFFIILGFVIATSIAAPLLFSEKLNSGKICTDLVSILIYFIVMAILILIAYIVNSRRKLYYNFCFKLKNLRLIPLMLLLLFSFQLGLNLPFQKLLFTLFNIKIVDSNYSWLHISSALILAPFLEELLFRGIIYKGLRSSYSAKHSILISAIIFGVFHGQPSMIPGAIFFGLFFGYVYYKTNSLGMTVILHFSTNLFGFVGSFLNLRFGNKDFKVISDYYGNFSLFLIVALFLVFLLSVYYLMNSFKKINFFDSSMSAYL